MSNITPKDMIAWLENTISGCEKYYVENSIPCLFKETEYGKMLLVIRAFIAKHSDPSMVLVPVNVFLALSQLLSATTDMCSPDGRFWNLDLSETRCVTLRNAIENAKKIIQAAKGE